jgi:uncharacterized membrane protein
VAVKVRHPGVTTLMQRDVTLMHRAAALSARLPGLAALRLDESVRQFGAPLREQVAPLAAAVGAGPGGCPPPPPPPPNSPPAVPHPPPPA